MGGQRSLWPIATSTIKGCNAPKLRAIFLDAAPAEYAIRSGRPTREPAGYDAKGVAHGVRKIQNAAVNGAQAYEGESWLWVGGRIIVVRTLTAGFLLTIALLAAGGADASPAFCVSVQGLPDECVYADGEECRLRAAQLGGACTLNRASVGSAFGSGQFCLAADNQATLCIYSDRSSCEADAARRHTACVQAVPQLNGAVDPYAIRRPY